MCAQATDNINKEELTRLLDRLGRMSRGLQYCHGLNPAQWDSLRFLAQANRSTTRVSSRVFSSGCCEKGFCGNAAIERGFMLKTALREASSRSHRSSQ